MSITDTLKTTLNTHHTHFQTITTTHLTDIATTYHHLQTTIPTLMTDPDYGLHRYPTLKPPHDAHSLIITATPQPITTLTLHHNGKTIPLPLPPTYPFSHNRATLLQALTTALHPDSVSLAIIPYKLTAVHSGLATYGKNNLAYIPGLGSFHRLEAFYTTAVLPDHWQPTQTNPACADCTLCTRACPMQAITPERFLIHADHCLTYHNESTRPFPADIPSRVHHAIVGCLRCQLACPLNKDVTGLRTVGPEFTEDETALLLKGIPKDELPLSLREKLRSVDLEDYCSVIARNLAFLLPA